MKYFIDRLIKNIKIKKSHICVGLDPHLDLLPPYLLKKAADQWEKPYHDESVLARAVWWFNREIIDQITDIVPAVKPQLAFYERLGSPGFATLKKTVSYARKKGLIVILDGKRNDIGSTARAYAEAYLKDDDINKLTVDAITLNPYLGFDSIKPFIEDIDKGSFILVKTSNESAGEIQDLELASGKQLYSHIAGMVDQWGEKLRGEYGYSNLGAVIGATYSEDLKILRKKIPHTYFLIPGYGFQGGSAEEVNYGFNEDGLGALINSSRGIIFAYNSDPWSSRFSAEEFGQAAREAALEMRNKINEAIG